MKKLYPLLEALVYVVAILVLLLSLPGCLATRELPATVPTRADSLLAAAGVPSVPQLLRTGRVKFNGPVTLQLGGAGNVATTTDASKAKAPVAAAPHATATETKTSKGVPWQVWAGGAALLLGLGFYAGHQFKIPWPF